MIPQLSRFQVVGLHGAKTMDVRLEDNTLVLVGENGTGKSTFVNLIYYFLTKQWTRLQEYQFEEIRAVLDGHELSLAPIDLTQHASASRHLRSLMKYSRGTMPPGRVTELFHWMTELTFQGADVREEHFVRQAAAELRIPVSAVRDLMHDYLSETEGKPTHVQTLEKYLSTLDLGQVLYLPTYRRIEQDLRSIFKGADIEEQLRKFRARPGRRSGAPYIELVEFGMEDVELMITERMARTKESVRTGLDNLTGTYLRDVIRGAHTQLDFTAMQHLDPAALDAVFARIDEATLPTIDKQHLKAKVEAIASSQGVEEQDKVIVHFLVKLTALYSEQQTNEQDVREFVRLSNRYLTDKQLVYDNTNYTIGIEETTSPHRPKDRNLEMRSLSSGEKQIVSLFSHLYLSGLRQYFVIIDEPELSLSVPWQRSFLPDILSTGMCSGLVAVTHSPFVWDNRLATFVRPLAEFTAPFVGERKPRSGDDR